MNFCSLQNQSVNDLMSEHLTSSPDLSSPLGHPVGSGNLSLCVLNYTSMLTGFNTDLQTAAWTQIVLSPKQVIFLNVVYAI